MTGRFLDFIGSALVVLIIWSLAGAAIAEHLGNAEAAFDFGLALLGSAVTLLAVEWVADRVAR